VEAMMSESEGVRPGEEISTDEVAGAAEARQGNGQAARVYRVVVIKDGEFVSPVQDEPTSAAS
jgi:hypothetical protein